MKKITLLCLLCLCFWDMNAQCTIDPFIQQNYEFDAKVLVLREIEGNPNDPDYDNPEISSTRTNYYLEQLSAMYINQQNSADLDSIFNEFQFHVDPWELQYHNILFSVDTNAPWVQSLKDTGLTGITAFDAVLAQYQFTVASANDYTIHPYEGKTIFTLESSIDFINTYALRNDLQNATTEDLSYDLGFFNDNICGYDGIPYTIETYELPPQQSPVVACDITKHPSNNYWVFTLKNGCLFNPPNNFQYRYVAVSNDCNQVNFSRTLSNEDVTLTNVSIYPNPASNHINIQGIENIQTVEINSIQGKRMQTSLSNSQIDIRRLKSGVYFLKIVDDQNRSVIKKFIKK
ncbi:putative secreted protein (Por secretion system target) [Kordia periserrulae]|uniref:Putative secreted protein (Por secretion system target) n=1 Tax=Kordia periserrulae TaxID=701523 RepID=A0A2T6C7A4_9FLAO|nr:T9SS type A sorting domain-containing protein [Kordia periserrulae]PTX64175.1 putative secreted protein (Por secretion system target) [Kordia periserrulae]